MEYALLHYQIEIDVKILLQKLFVFELWWIRILTIVVFYYGSSLDCICIRLILFGYPNCTKIFFAYMRLKKKNLWNIIIICIQETSTTENLFKILFEINCWYNIPVYKNYTIHYN